MIKMLKDKLILVKGAGDFASGSIRRLHLAGAKVICTELPQPLTVRRKVAFSEAIYNGEHTVEGVTGVKATTNEIDQYFKENKIPIIIDPETSIKISHRFDIIIDARMAKRNLDTNISEAPIVIGLGPGFTAGLDCHVVVETLAGHNLGRVIYEGKAAEDTGMPVPTDVGLTTCCAGFDVNTLVLRAPDNGIFKGLKEIGQMVNEGDVIGTAGGCEVIATASGVLRGLIHDGVQVTKGLKIGDIDPSGEVSRVTQISEKANAIAGGVLEACLYSINKRLILE